MKKRFAEDLVKELEGKVSDGCKLAVAQTKKNNGKVCTGISFAERDEELAQIFYVDDLFKDVACECMNIEEAAEVVIGWYEKHGKEEARPEVPAITQEWIRQNVVCCVVNAEMNKEMLADVPHKMFEDLAVVYRCFVEKSHRGVASFLVKNGMCDLSLEELHEIAMENTEKKSGFECENMSALIGIPNKSPLWIMTNKDRMNGASILLFDYHFEALSELLDDDLYVMPSSIHEVLAVSASLISVDEAREMVEDANSTVVEQEEILGNNVYIYSRKDGTLKMA